MRKMRNIELHVFLWPNTINGVMYTLKEKGWDYRVDGSVFSLGKHILLKEIECLIKGYDTTWNSLAFGSIFYTYGKKEKPYLYFFEKQHLFK